VPRTLERMRLAGMDLPTELFERGRKFGGKER